MKIVFMGTSEFSIPTLEKLLSTRHEILSVYTKKPQKSDRNYKLQNTPIHNFALKNNLRVFTPGTFKNGKNLEDLRTLKPDLVVVVAYGLILTKELLKIPRYGCLNIHPSLLPRWRGCAPIERCLMSDDEETGVCVMKIDEGLDSGDVIFTEKTPINKNTDTKYLHETLADIGANLLLKAVNIIEKNGYIDGIKQNDSLATFTEKITNADALIDWRRDSVVKIHKKIMALGDSVGVFTKHEGNIIKILKSDYIQQATITNAVCTVVDKYFSIQCMDGILRPLVVQREGKKAMNINDFVNGYRVQVNTFISSPTN
ncbi:MAG: methionyl-tRNA formyltransferase [Rickettsiales bacterium]|jgi:methionyl-tRNA formyltransferase|nr:methionyl-tRNA formyltransferase [Rickettsiales bacterium]